MPISALDSRSALVVIDLQKGIAALPTVHHMTGIIEQARLLAHGFRQRELPVVLVNVIGMAPGRTEQRIRTDTLPADWTELLPELNAQARDLLISKRTWGAFMHTDLASRLRAMQVTQVVIAGVATSIGVESTARQAFEEGFNVTLVTDAMTDINSAAHEHSIQAIFPRLGETGTTQEVLQFLERAP